MLLSSFLQENKNNVLNKTKKISIKLFVNFMKKGIYCSVNEIKIEFYFLNLQNCMIKIVFGMSKTFSICIQDTIWNYSIFSAIIYISLRILLKKYNYDINI